MEDFPVNLIMMPPMKPPMPMMPMMSGMMGGMMGGMTPQPTSTLASQYATDATALLAKMPALPPAQISTVMNPPPRPAGFHPPKPQSHKPIPPKGMPANVKTLMAAHKAPVKSTLSKPSTTVSTSSTLTQPPTVTGSSSTSMVLPLAGGLVVLLFLIMRR